MLKYLSVGSILQALVIQQTVAWAVFLRQPLPTSPTGKENPIATPIKIQNNLTTVLQKTTAWGVLRQQPLFSSPTGKEIPVDTLNQRLQFFQNYNTTENRNYTEHFKHGGNCQYTNLDAKNVVNSLKTAMHFYQDHSYLDNQKQDVLLGLLTLKGNLFHIKKNIEETMKDSEFSKQVNHLLEKSRKLSTTLLEHSSNRTARGANVGNEVYMQRNNTEVWGGPTGAWKSFDIIPKYQNQFSNIEDDIDATPEFENCKCLSTLMIDCDVPSDCQSIYLEKAHSQYMLTQQVLFLNLAESKLCMAEEKNVAKFKDWETFRETLCAKAFEEAQFIAKNGFHFMFKDLFSERVAFCGTAGFPNFMRLDWLNEILSWQSKGAHGCFKDIYGDIKTTDETVNITTNDTSGESFVESCLIHFTAVSMSAVATHFRYMFDTCSADIFKHVL